jgi:hypothetical protein
LASTNGNKSKDPRKNRPLREKGKEHILSEKEMNVTVEEIRNVGQVFEGKGNTFFFCPWNCCNFF